MADAVFGGCLAWLVCSRSKFPGFDLALRLLPALTFFFLLISIYVYLYIIFIFIFTAVRCCLSSPILLTYWLFFFLPFFFFWVPFWAAVLSFLFFGVCPEIGFLQSRSLKTRFTGSVAVHQWDECRPACFAPLQSTGVGYRRPTIRL